MTEFEILYDNYSNAELLYIIQNPSKYQSLAVQAAKKIIANRNLSENEIVAAQAELHKKATQKKQEETQKKDFENRLKEQILSFFQSFNPIQSEEIPTLILVRNLSVVFCSIIFLRIITQFSIITSLIKNPEWDFSVFLFFLPFILVPLGTLHFYLQKRLGWTLLMIFLTSTTLENLDILRLSINNSFFFNEAIDKLFKSNKQVIHLTLVLFYLGLVWTLLKPTLRSFFSVDKGFALRTIALTIVVKVVLIFIFFN